MSYDITIQPKGANAPQLNREQIESFIASLPGVRRDGAQVFAYTGGQGNIFMSIYVDDSADGRHITVSVPGAFTGSSGEAALLLCFRIADHLGWEVFDEQSGDILKKDTLQQVLKDQRRYGRSEEEVLSRRASGETGFWDCLLGYELLNHRKTAVITTLALAVAGTALLAIYVPGFANSDRKVPIGFVVIWGMLLGIKAVFVASRKTWRSASKGQSDGKAKRVL
jgi:hypothetical protein